MGQNSKGRIPLERDMGQKVTFPFQFLGLLKKPPTNWRDNNGRTLFPLLGPLKKPPTNFARTKNSSNTEILAFSICQMGSKSRGGGIRWSYMMLLLTPQMG